MPIQDTIRKFADYGKYLNPPNPNPADTYHPSQSRNYGTFEPNQQVDSRRYHDERLRYANLTPEARQQEDAAKDARFQRERERHRLRMEAERQQAQMVYEEEQRRRDQPYGKADYKGHDALSDMRILGRAASVSYGQNLAAADATVQRTVDQTGRVVRRNLGGSTPRR
ncbi:MAG: hypothetical protein Q9222_006384 [Ikaeria aurantiellina]